MILDEADVRASRLVNMLLMLQARERVTASELAVALEVSVRTVHRDIEALSAAGVPVYAERGARGGFRLLGARRFALTALTGHEAAAVRWIGVPAVARALGLDRERQAAEIKLLDALPETARAEAQAAAEDVLVDLGVEPDRRVMRGLRRAIRDRRVLHIRRHEERGQRPYAPLGLVWTEGAWRLVARDVQAGRLVTLPLDALALVRRGAETFTRPPGFDLASAWRSAQHLPER